MVTHEPRMLFDGKLVESETGRQFDTINPAAKEVLCTAEGTRADMERAVAAARRAFDHILGINGGLWYGADAPFGGYKQSGIGRQCGIEGLEIFTETKTVGWPAS